MKKLAGTLTAINCAYVAIQFGIYQYPDIFPLPFLYLLEIALLGLLVAWISWRERDAMWLWPTIGILLSFVILGGFSIGSFLIPAALFTLLLALSLNDETSLPPRRALGLFAAGGALQSGIMLGLVAIQVALQ
jgi:hypothetical protein